MRSRSIASSLLFLAACGGGGTNTREEAPVTEGRMLKVTYLRFEKDQKSQRFVPAYRVMISRAWHSKYGDNPNEPLTKLFRRGVRSPFLGQVPDVHMENLLRELDRKGIGKLRSSRPEDIDLVRLAQAEKNPELAQSTRIITIGDETGHRSFEWEKNVDKAFLDCEKEVLKMAIQYTAQVTTGTEPFMPRD